MLTARIVLHRQHHLNLDPGKDTPEQRDKARGLGLGFAMVSRLLLLFTLSWVMGLTADLFTVVGQGISGRDLVLGGLFRSTKPAMRSCKVEARAGGSPAADAVQMKAAGKRMFWGIIGQIAIIGITVFSLDLNIAVGMWSTRSA
jgi:predicted tellurium resistance membrane protein TerC